MPGGLLRPPRSCLVLARCPLPPVLQLFSVFYFRTESLACQPPSSAFFRTITITLVPTYDSGSVPRFKVLSLVSLLPRRSGYLQIVGTQVFLTTS